MSGSRGEHRPIFTAMLDGPDYQALTPEARLVLLTLKIMLPAIGIAAVPALEGVLAERTGLDGRAIEGALMGLLGGGWIERERNVVWLVRGLQHEPGISAKDVKHRKMVAKQAQSLPRLAITSRWVERYAEYLDEDALKGLRRAFEGVSSIGGSPHPPPHPLPPPQKAGADAPLEESVGAWYGRVLKPLCWPKGTSRENESRDVSVLKRQLGKLPREQVEVAVRECRVQAEEGRLEGWIGKGEGFGLMALCADANGGVAVFERFRVEGLKRGEAKGERSGRASIADILRGAA